jgi:hypothetical protein
VIKTTLPDGSFAFTPAPGALRLWTQDGTQYRLKEQVNNYITVNGAAVQNGDYIAPNVVYAATNMPSVLYVEGIQPGVYTITVQLDPDGQSGFILSHQITVTVVSVDADADFANMAGFGMLFNTIDDDYDQYNPSVPSKIVGVNDGDTDEDGIPGYADGFGFNPTNVDQAVSTNDQFTPIILSLPPDVNVSMAMLRINYTASDPKGLTQSGNPLTWHPASGNLRIWTKDGNQPRSMTNVDDRCTPGGNFVPGDYHVFTDITKFGFSETVRTITNYIEGIAPSGSLGDQQITVDLDPYGDGNWVALDTFYVTVLQANLGITRSDGSSVGHDQKYPNGSVVQITPQNNPSGLYPYGLFLSLPNLSIQPAALSSYVTLKLIKTPRQQNLWADSSGSGSRPNV